MNVLERLNELSDLKYKEFNKKIISNEKYIIGVRTNDLKLIAKELVLNNELDYLNLPHKYHEEKMIYMFMLSYIKDYKLVYDKLASFVPYISNWAVCDSITNIKIIKKHRDYFYNLVLKYIKSKKEYELRFSIVMLLFHYICDEYIDNIYNMINIALDNANDYYSKMAISWLLCELMIKYRDKTLLYIKENEIDPVILNKSISKMCDSYRISNDDKEFLKTLKIR